LKGESIVKNYIDGPKVQENFFFVLLPSIYTVSNLHHNHLLNLIPKKMRVFSSMVTALVFFASSALAQESDRDTFFPRTSSAVVLGYYHELAQKPTGISRGLHADRVFTKYFSKDYVEYGGKGTKRQTFKPFKEFVVGAFTAMPDLNVVIEEMISSGEKVAVKIKLFDEKSGTIINYVAIYYVENGQIKNRYWYSYGVF